MPCTPASTCWRRSMRPAPRWARSSTRSARRKASAPPCAGAPPSSRSSDVVSGRADPLGTRGLRQARAPRGRRAADRRRRPVQRRLQRAGPGLRVLRALAVLTGADAAADGLKPIPHRPVPANPYEPQLANRDGAEHFVAPHPPLPADRVRLVGEAVAMVIAETAAAARDGAEAVSVEYEPLPVVISAAQATAPGAPLVWEEAGSNVCVDSECGDAAAADAAFAH